MATAATIPTTRKAPAQKAFVVDPGQFQQIVHQLHENHNVTHLDDEGMTGAVTYEKDIEFSWKYDGTGILTVFIHHKHGEMRLVPDAVIFGRLEAQLVKFRLAPAPVIKAGAAQEQYESQDPSQVDAFTNRVKEATAKIKAGPSADAKDQSAPEYPTPAFEGSTEEHAVQHVDSDVVEPASITPDGPVEVRHDEEQHS